MPGMVLTILYETFDSYGKIKWELYCLNSLHISEVSR
jgi:hypothetical protein